MVLVTQWLSARIPLSDWRTNTQTGAGNRVSLEKQQGGLAAHPLPMAQPWMLGAGFQRPITPAISRLPLWDITEPSLADVLGTEDLAPICDQNGSPLGMT